MSKPANQDNPDLTSRSQAPAWECGPGGSGLRDGMAGAMQESVPWTEFGNEGRISYPEEWETTNFGSISIVQSGVGFPITYQGKTHELFPVYKVSDISNAVLNCKGYLSVASNSVSEKDAKALKGTIFKKGTTLFAKIGEAVRLNRRAFVIKNGLADNNVMGITPIIDEMDKFIFYFMKTVDLSDMSRSTTVPSIRKGDIETVVLALPPLAEQKQIADRLDALLAQVDTLKTRLDAIPAILKRFRQSVLAAAVSGKLTEGWRDSNECEENAEQLILRIAEDRKNKNFVTYIINGKKVKYKPKIGLEPDLRYLNHTPPDNWTIASVSQFAECLDSLRVPVKKEYRKCDVGKYPYFGANGKVDDVDEFIFDDDIVLVTEDETFYGRKKPIAYRYSGKCWVNNHVHVLRSITSVSNDYLCFSMMYYHVLPWLSGTTGRAKLTQNALNILPILVPPLNEQTEIVRRVDQLFAFADQIEQRVAEARKRVDHLTPSILAKAFRGDLTADWRAENPGLISGENSAEALLARIRAERAEAAASPARKPGKRSSAT